MNTQTIQTDRCSICNEKSSDLNKNDLCDLCEEWHIVCDVCGEIKDDSDALYICNSEYYCEDGPICGDCAQTSCIHCGAECDEASSWCLECTAALERDNIDDPNCQACSDLFHEA